MDGKLLIDEFARRIMEERGTGTIRDTVLANSIGLTLRQLKEYRSKELTAREVTNLAESYAKAMERQLVADTVVPIVEFLFLDVIETKRGAGWQIFGVRPEGEEEDHPYFAGLKQSLDSKHGIYIFHDSRGRAIYAGKAQRQSLWKEMNKAFNRDRGEVQNIKRVAHPTNRVEYRPHAQQGRKIVKESVALYNIASYCSAYEVPDQLIGKFEALIVRAFANDLLNVRMETL